MLLREDVTYHVCYDSQEELIDAVTNFQNRINTNPIAISDRLWVKKHLEPEEEKQRGKSIDKEENQTNRSRINIK